MSFSVDRLYKKIDYKNNIEVEQLKSECEVFKEWFSKQPQDDIMPYEIYDASCHCGKISWIPPNPDTRGALFRLMAPIPYKKLSKETYENYQATSKDKIKYKYSVYDIDALTTVYGTGFSYDERKHFMKTTNLPEHLKYKISERARY